MDPELSITNEPKPLSRGSKPTETMGGIEVSTRRQRVTEAAPEPTVDDYARDLMASMLNARQRWILRSALAKGITWQLIRASLKRTCWPSPIIDCMGAYAAQLNDLPMGDRGREPGKEPGS